QKNYNLLLKILDTKRSKNLKVELIKVKEYNNNYWNDRVDKLAKEVGDGSAGVKIKSLL
ncbi:23076_t:CDS:2, partial [Gigaspora margarita]